MYEAREAREALERASSSALRAAGAVHAGPRVLKDPEPLVHPAMHTVVVKPMAIGFSWGALLVQVKLHMATWCAMHFFVSENDSSTFKKQELAVNYCAWPS